MNNLIVSSHFLANIKACLRNKRLLSIVTSPLFGLFLVMVFLSSCHPIAREGLESLRSEVMAIHDEAMARMGEMHELEVKMRTRVDELKALGQQAEVELKALALLQQAQRAMMEWMHQYKQPDMNGDRQQIKTYLLAQKEKIIGVRELIKTALQEAVKPLYPHPAKDKVAYTDPDIAHVGLYE